LTGDFFIISIRKEHGHNYIIEKERGEAFRYRTMILTSLSKFQEQEHESDAKNHEIVSLWDNQHS
jgi:hypothetical protein